MTVTAEPVTPEADIDVHDTMAVCFVTSALKLNLPRRHYLTLASSDRLAELIAEATSEDGLLADQLDGEVSDLRRASWLAVARAIDQRSHVRELLAGEHGQRWLREARFRREVGARLGGAVPAEEAVPLDQRELVERTVRAHLGLPDDAPVGQVALERCRELSFAGEPLTDAGLGLVAGCRRLEYLNLAFTDVTDAGVAWLQERLPHLKVTHSPPRDA